MDNILKYMATVAVSTQMGRGMDKDVHVLELKVEKKEKFIEELETLIYKEIIARYLKEVNLKELIKNSNMLLVRSIIKLERNALEANYVNFEEFLKNKLIDFKKQIINL